jgi:hypothetical protein
MCQHMVYLGMILSYMCRNLAQSIVGPNSIGIEARLSKRRRLEGLKVKYPRQKVL